MAAKRTRMSTVKQILRLRLQGHSLKAITRLTQTAKNTVKKYVRLAEVSSYSLQELVDWEDEKLDQYFLRKPNQETGDRQKDLEELLPYYFEELKRVGVTKWILWGEYRQKYPDGFGYSRFCGVLLKHSKQQKGSMHMEHIAGDKIFMDFAGKKLKITDKQTGAIEEVEVFVAILGYSQLTYVEAVSTQTIPDVIGACANAMHFLGGSPKAIVCDNLKAAVTKPCRYEPTINIAFDDFANHYGMTVLPTRSRKPQDKGSVERAVGITYNRIYAPLRDRIFYSLRELNHAIQEVLLLHNQIRFQNVDITREELFKKEEKALLNPLPDDRYQVKFYRQVTVMKNNYIQLREDVHYYSVPYRYIGKEVKIIYTRDHVSIYYQGERIAYHIREYSKNRYTTEKEHLASHHQFVADWNPERFLSWASGIDPVVKQYIQEILNRRTHPEQAYKSCTGILSLSRKGGKENLIAACAKAQELGVYSYIFIRRIIENGFAMQYKNPSSNQTILPFHENIRGAENYQ